MPHAIPATLNKRPHASLSRPRAVPVDALPERAVVNRTRTPWQEITHLLASDRGNWFRLTRTYQSPVSAVQSCRKVLESDHDADTASMLESAFEEALEGGVFRVYLRIAPEMELEEEEV